MVQKKNKKLGMGGNIESVQLELKNALERIKRKTINGRTFEGKHD